LGTDSISFGVSPGDRLSPDEIAQKTKIELLELQQQKPKYTSYASILSA
jgi:hypothetical protein